MTTATFYRTTSKRNEVNKTLSLATDIEIRITSPAEDLIRPILEVRRVNGQYNYVLLYERYYYIIKKEQLLDGRERLYLEEDVLSTWYNRCEVTGIIEKSSTNYTMDLKQNFPKQVNSGIKRIVFDDLQPHLGSTVIAQSTYNYAPKPTQGGE